MKTKALITSIALLLAPTIAPAIAAPNEQYPDEYSSISEQEFFTSGQLAQMLAPVALYPDTLLTHILIAASYPLEVVDAYRWREANKSLSERKFNKKLARQDWDESVKALVPFEQVLKQMHDDLTWMRELGDAFLAQEQDVLDTIQTLRQQAREAGHLNDFDNAEIVNDREKIVIVSRDPQVVYVPYYDPRVVFGHWRWHRYPPVYWHSAHYDYYRPISWHVGVHIGFRFFFNAIHWHNRYVVVNHHKERRYRKRHHILSSGYSKRWAHKPQHRRKVAYRSASVREKYKHARDHNVRFVQQKREGKLVRKTHEIKRDKTLKNLSNSKTKIRHKEKMQTKHFANKGKHSFDRKVSKLPEGAVKNANKPVKAPKHKYASKVQQHSNKPYRNADNRLLTKEPKRKAQEKFTSKSFDKPKVHKQPKYRSSSKSSSHKVARSSSDRASKNRTVRSSERKH